MQDGLIACNFEQEEAIQENRRQMQAISCLPAARVHCKMIGQNLQKLLPQDSADTAAVIVVVVVAVAVVAIVVFRYRKATGFLLCSLAKDRFSQPAQYSEEAQANPTLEGMLVLGSASGSRNSFIKHSIQTLNPKTPRTLKPYTLGSHRNQDSKPS